MLAFPQPNRYLPDGRGWRVGADVNVRVVGAGETAEALRKALARAGLAERAGAPVAFVCAADDLTRAIAMRELAERLRKRLADVSEQAGLPVRGSIGVAAVSSDELDSPDAAEDLLRRADEALYNAKRSGRDRVEVAHIPH